MTSDTGSVLMSTSLLLPVYDFAQPTLCKPPWYAKHSLQQATSDTGCFSLSVSVIVTADMPNLLCVTHIGLHCIFAAAVWLVELTAAVSVNVFTPLVLIDNQLLSISVSVSLLTCDMHNPVSANHLGMQSTLCSNVLTSDTGCVNIQVSVIVTADMCILLCATHLELHSILGSSCLASAAGCFRLSVNVFIALVWFGT